MLYDHTIPFERISGRKMSVREADGAIVAEVDVPVESLWFDGHFPDDPILPGVAQLAMIGDILTEALRRKVSVTRLTRVRFKQVIRPGTRLLVEIRPKAEKASTYEFQLSSGAEQLLSGNLSVAE